MKCYLIVIDDKIIRKFLSREEAESFKKTLEEGTYSKIEVVLKTVFRDDKLRRGTKYERLS